MLTTLLLLMVSTKYSKEPSLRIAATYCPRVEAGAPGAHLELTIAL